MKEKIKRTWVILKACVVILGKDKRLLVFPLINAGFSLLFVLYTFAVIFGNSSFLSQYIPENKHTYLLLVILPAVPLLIVSIFLNCALTSCVLSGLNGEKVSLQKGLGESLRQYKAILSWSLISLLIAPIFVLSQKYFQWFGNKIATWLGITAWGIGTSFVVTILVFEKHDLKTCIRKSFNTVKSVWTEMLSFNGGIAILSYLALVPASLLLVKAINSNFVAVATLIFIYFLIIV